MPTVKQLDRKHPEWQLRSDQWENIRLLYEGAIEMKNNGDNFVPRRPKEMFDVFYERQRRLTYQNILQSALGWYLGKLFQNDPEIKPSAKENNSDDRFAAFLQDCDQCGGTFVNVAGRQLLEMMMLYRRAFVLIDKPKRPDPSVATINTRADEKALGLDQPYVVLYEPKNVFNWQLDKYGNLKWIIIKTVEDDQDDPLGPSQRVANWYVFDRQKFQHFQFKSPEKDTRNIAAFWKDSVLDDENAQPELVDAGPHALSAFDQVPVRCCELPLSLWFANRTYLQILEHVDQYNGYTWKLFMSNYPQLVIQTERELTGITKSEVSFVQLDPNDKIFYLEPDGKSLDHSRMQLMDLRQEVYRGFHLQAQAKQNTATADGASGYSKEMEMAPAVDMLAAFGDILRAQQQLILTDYKKCAGMPYDGTDQPDVNGYRFETKPIMQNIAVAQAVVDLGLPDKSPTLERYLDKQVAIAAMDGANEDDKEAALKEIDEAPTRKEQKDAEQQAQADAFQKSFQRNTAKQVIAGEQAAVAA
jgi:hypothetical protein